MPMLEQVRQWKTLLVHLENHVFYFNSYAISSYNESSRDDTGQLVVSLRVLVSDNGGHSCVAAGCAHTRNTSLDGLRRISQAKPCRRVAVLVIFFSWGLAITFALPP
jgi:hypothetical protein